VAWGQAVSVPGVLLSWAAWDRRLGSPWRLSLGRVSHGRPWVTAGVTLCGTGAAAPSHLKSIVSLLLSQCGLEGVAIRAPSSPGHSGGMGHRQSKQSLPGTFLLGQQGVLSLGSRVTQWPEGSSCQFSTQGRYLSAGKARDERVTRMGRG
jgi:hypothetical protein